MASSINAQNPSFEGKGITTDNSSRDPYDEEARYAAIAAALIGIKHDTLPVAPPEDFYAFCGTPEPYAWPFAATLRRFGQTMRCHAKVMLTGHGGDPLFRGSGFDILDHFRDDSLPRFLAWLLCTAKRKRSLRGLGWRALLDRDLARIRMPTIPAWVRPDLLERCDSQQRWEALFYRRGRYPRGCRTELTWDEIHSPFWSQLFEAYYHNLFAGIDCRHPFFDLRLVNFLLALPASVLVNKHLLRESVRNMLPEPLLQRRKSVILGDVIQPALAAHPQSVPADLGQTPLAQWIDIPRYSRALQAFASGHQTDFLVVLCPLSLLMWMEQKDMVG